MELFKLFGESPNSKKITNFLTKLNKNYSKNEEVKKFKSCVYHSYKKLGISFEFCIKNTSKTLENIHIYRSGAYKNFSGYSGKLPYDLSLEMNNVVIVKKFGEPDKKGGGPMSIPVWIEYSKKGIHIQFVSKDWDDMNNVISSMVIFKPEK